MQPFTYFKMYIYLLNNSFIHYIKMIYLFVYLLENCEQ